MFIYNYEKEISQSCIMKIKEGTFLELKLICYRFTHCMCSLIKYHPCQNNNSTNYIGQTMTSSLPE